MTSLQSADLVPAVLAEYGRAGEAIREAGRDWYPSAEREARAIAALAPRGIGPSRGAAIIAALSPRAQWVTNLRWAGQVAAAAAIDADCPAVGLLPNRAKAWRIAHGEDPREVLGGPKVRAFWRNLAGDPEAVTVDVWAAKAVGQDPNRLTPARYRAIAEAYRTAAHETGEDPRDIQAIVWLSYRGVKPADPLDFRPTDPVDSALPLPVRS